MNDYNYSSGTDSGSPLGGLIALLVFVGLYVYISYSLYAIAKKTNTPNAWLAWIPVANLFLMLMIAKKPLVVVYFVFNPVG